MTLCNKDKFRDFLRRNGFNAPKSGGYGDKEAVKEDIGSFNLPVIIKPVDSSGSKCITVIDKLHIKSGGMNVELMIDKNGQFAGITYSDKIKPFIVKECIYKKERRSNILKI